MDEREEAIAAVDELVAMPRVNIRGAQRRVEQLAESNSSQSMVRSSALTGSGRLVGRSMSSATMARRQGKSAGRLS